MKMDRNKTSLFRLSNSNRQCNFTIYLKVILLVTFLTKSGLANDLYFDEDVCPVKCLCSYWSINTPDLQHVNCSGNTLTTLPEGIDIKVEVLDLSNNKFRRIPTGIRNFTALLRLNFADNILNGINPNAFTGLNELTQLDLSRNNFSIWASINAAHFIKGLKSLTDLNLSFNNFQDALKNNDQLVSDSLETLKMRRAVITEIQNHTFNKLSKLIELDLAENPLTTFSGFVSNSLKRLDMSNCQLKHIKDGAFNNLPHLETLFLSGNHNLQFYPQFKLVSSSLKIIDLSNCNIKSTQLPGFPNLTHISLRGNLIRELPENAFKNNSKLNFIDLSRTGITRIHSRAFKTVRELFALDLSENMISNIHWKTFSANTRLDNLNLSRNHLTEVGNLSIDSLVRLDLSTCEIEKIDSQSLMGMPKLDILNLAHNLLETVPTNFESTSLRVLDMSFCRLTKLKESAFKQLIRLTKLNLIGNRLTEGLRSTMFPDSLTEIWLGDNPWRCDCYTYDFRKFYEYLKTPPSKVYNEDLLICHSPQNLSSYTWYGACSGVWSPSYMKVNNSQRVWMFLLTTFLTLGGLLCIVMTARRALLARQMREREECERQLEEARERLRRLRQRNRPEPQQNAPDPRDLVSPPSYEEAILMPRPDGSHASLDAIANSTHSLNTGADRALQKQKKRRQCRSEGNLLTAGQSHHHRNKKRNRRQVNGSQSTVVTVHDDETEMCDNISLELRLKRTTSTPEHNLVIKQNVGPSTSEINALNDSESQRQLQEAHF